MEVILYRTETCPMCKILKTKMEQKGIPFVEVKELHELAKNGITEVPQLRVDGGELMGMAAANKWINSQEVQTNG